MKYYRRHKNFIFVFTLFFLGFFLVTYLSFRLINNRVLTDYKRVFEKKSLSQLDIYHEGIKRLFNRYFENRVDIIENLSHDLSLQEVLLANDLKQAQIIINKQQQINNKFDSLGLLDAKGILVVTSNTRNQRFLGQDFSYRDYYQKVLETKKLYITDLLHTIAGNNAIIFSAPIFNTRQEITHVVVGSVLLPSLAESLSLQTEFADFYYVVIDRVGNLLLENDQEVTGFKNVKLQDRAVERLLSGETEYSDEEINYKGERVFVKASTIDLKNKNKIYLATYFPKQQFDEEITQMTKELKKTEVELFSLYAILFVVITGIIFYYFKRHEELHAKL